jgi:hypothetical protein
MQWIDGLRTTHGVSVVGLTADKADDRSLTVEVSFERAGS